MEGLHEKVFPYSYYADRTISFFSPAKLYYTSNYYLCLCVGFSWYGIIYYLLRQRQCSMKKYFLDRYMEFFSNV